MAWVENETNANPKAGVNPKPIAKPSLTAKPFGQGIFTTVFRNLQFFNLVSISVNYPSNEEDSSTSEDLEYQKSGIVNKGDITGNAGEQEEEEDIKTAEEPRNSYKMSGATKKKQHSVASEIPLLFTVTRSNRHELFIISTAASYDDLASEIATLAATSPNCEEFMSKYKKKGEQKVVDIKVKWGASGGRDEKIWPKTTKLTEENTEAVLMMMERGGGLGRDVLEVRLEGMPEEPEEKK